MDKSWLLPGANVSEGQGEKAADRALGLGLSTNTSLPLTLHTVGASGGSDSHSGDRIPGPSALEMCGWGGEPEGRKQPEKAPTHTHTHNTHKSHYAL